MVLKLADRIAKNSHFVSEVNPLATVDQRDCEAHALLLIEHPTIVAARKACAHRWRSLVGNDPSEEAWSRFDSLIEECVFAALMKAVNGDPNHPKITRIVMPPHEWFGMKVPGSRFAGGPGIDQSYAIAPIDFGTRYEIRGQWIHPAPADHVYNVVGNPSMWNVLSQLEYAQLKVEADGTFVIGVGPDPGEQANHILTKPGAQYLFIRDCRADWRERATALTIERLDPPSRPSWNDQQIADRAAHIMLEDASAMYVWMRYFQNMIPNTVSVPFGTGDFGGLVAQSVSFADIKLADDEAFVLHVDPADAAFFDVQINDYWFHSIGDYVGRTASFNGAQSACNPDGTITYVVSIQDPGVHNWLDTNGVHEALLVQRWQRLPMHPGRRQPNISGELVKLRDLDFALPAGTPHLDSAGRRKQVADRIDTYNLRLVDR